MHFNTSKEKGLSWTGDNGFTIRLCDYIEISSIVLDKDGDQWGKLFQFYNSNNTLNISVVAFSDMHNQSKVMQQLRDRGFNANGYDSLVFKYIADSKVESVITRSPVARRSRPSPRF